MIFDTEFKSNATTLPADKHLVDSIKLATGGAMQGVTVNVPFEEVHELLQKSRKPVRPNRAKPA